MPRVLPHGKRKSSGKSVFRSQKLPAIWSADWEFWLTKKTLFGVDGQPMLGVAGFAEMRNEYDEFGNKTKMSFFGVDGKPTLCKESFAQGIFGTDAFATAHWEYDAHGAITKEEYFGVDGKPISP